MSHDHMFWGVLIAMIGIILTSIVIGLIMEHKD